MFFGPIRKTRWPPWPLIGWDIFNFSSETVERNSTKLDRKTKWPLWLLIGWDVFDFSSETAERNSMKLDRKQDLNVLYQVCIFWVDWKNKVAALASDLLRHFWLLLWNCWIDRRQDLNVLYQVCVFGPISKQKWPPRLISQKGGTLYLGAWYVTLWASCLFALGNERTLVTCKSCEAWSASQRLTRDQCPFISQCFTLLKDLRATNVLSFPNANKKKCTSILKFLLKRQITPESWRNQCQFFGHVTGVFHWKIFATVFLCFHRRRMTSEFKYKFV